MKRSNLLLTVHKEAQQTLLHFTDSLFSCTSLSDLHVSCIKSYVFGTRDHGYFGTSLITPKIAEQKALILNMAETLINNNYTVPDSGLHEKAIVAFGKRYTNEILTSIITVHAWARAISA